MSSYNSEFLETVVFKKLKYTKGIQKSMLTSVSCLFFYFVGLTVFFKKKIQPENYIGTWKKNWKSSLTHTLKITKHQVYLFCDMVSLTDQRNIGRLKINSTRSPSNTVYFKGSTQSRKFYFSVRILT